MSLYAVGWGGEQDDVGVVRGSSKIDSIALVASTGVVVLDVGLQHAVQVVLAGDEVRSVHSRRTEAIQRSAMAFIRGACGAVSTVSIPIEAKTAPYPLRAGGHRSDSRGNAVNWENVAV